MLLCLGHAGMTDNFNQVASTTAIETYAIYSSSSDEGQESAYYVKTSVQTLSDDDYNPTLPPASTFNSNQLQPLSQELLDRLTLNEQLDFNIVTADFEGGTSEEENETEPSETASNSSSAGTLNGDCAISSKSIEECVAGQDDESDGDDDDFVQGYARIPMMNSDALDESTKEKANCKSSSSSVISTLKRRWKGMKKASARGTSSAGKGLSSISTSYFTGGRETETWEQRHTRIGDEWINSVIPSWQKKRKTSRVRTLVFRGIPANVRGRVWQCAIGNPLNVSEELFVVLKDRAAKGRAEYLRGRDTLALADGDLGGHGGRAESLMENERSAHKAISLDLPRTFPELSFFHAEGSHYENALRDVLEAFLYLKPDVGYSQGMSFVAAVLLLYMDPYDAFSCFANMLLYKSCFLHFFRIKMPEVRCYLMVHEKFLLEEMPPLYHHFKQHGIESDLYMINWVMSLYCRALPLDLVTRIWDLYVLDGDLAIFRAALGILRLFMTNLLKMKFEDMAYFLSHIPGDQIQPDRLIHSIRSVRVVTRRKFVDFFKECREEIDQTNIRR